MAAVESDSGAFMEKFTLHPPTSSPQHLPLNGLTFAIKYIFDVKGYVTGFGNPDWAKTHLAAVSTAPAVLALLNAGATSVGKTVMDEMAYSLEGENIHYGTPINPCAADQISGGSSSGSAVAVAAKLVDFSLGTDTGESCRYEFRINHEEWISSVKPDLGPVISERLQEALVVTSENIDICHTVRNELCAALTELLEEFGILAIPTVPGPPLKLQTETVTVENFRARAFSLLPIAGNSKFCQVNIPLGMYDNLPVAVSLLAKHGADGFLLNLVENLDCFLKEQIEITQGMSF